LFPTNTTLSVAGPFDPGAAEAGTATSAQAATAIAAEATLNAFARLPPVIARHTLIGKRAWRVDAYPRVKGNSWY
jgi:hypothetical protein